MVGGLRRGEAAAFDAAYQAYRDRIYGFLLRLSGRRHVADDLFQETFLRLARAATTLREDTELAAWLFTVARNQWRSHQRWLLGGGGRPMPAEALDGALEPAPGPRPDEQAERRAALRALEQALAELPDGAREILLLCGVEELPQEQVAEILGIGYDALRQRLTRARTQLAEALARRELGSTSKAAVR